ncbi:phage terminase large subunit [Ponticaulis sp.]|uniref:PBSX family phage terminase large subunit n=1 Tax=Ponticaulis sp. TaxID=2020902 RepID=UPI000C4C35B3|nr:phage terminase large subunit [Ponticaulis sp.]MAF57819.1 PBSX family phage terminase large subunit [Ponticaulis sp.]MBN04514.1 PBSX family phage terminase large subunit [Ponticaulis sp.]
MTTLQIKLPEKLVPVFEGEADVRGAYGGRGSAKTRSFAKMLCIKGRIFAEAGIRGVIVCGREFQNSLDESSMAEVKAAIESEPWLEEFYEVGEKYVRTKCGLVEFKFVGLRLNLESIKSKARILIIWVDEAESVTDYAWQIVLPTLREEGSDWNAELWVTWNPEREASATHKRFRLLQSDRVKVRELNWRDNPWFPAKLDRQRQMDMQTDPDDYDWIWEGKFRTHYKGAYYAKHLSQANAEGRIRDLHVDPSLTLRTWHDLAGAGDKADAYSIWTGQFVGQQVWMLGHYCTEGQSSAYHIDWLRTWCLDRGIKRCVVTLPHDGDQVKQDYSWRNIWNAASEPGLVEFITEVIPNQGRGAAMKRVEESRKIFPRVWFDEEGTKAGRQALAAYHERRDDNRNVGLGPNHDWASHDADSFGLMACTYKPPGDVVGSDELKKALYGKSRGRGSYLAA